VKMKGVILAFAVLFAPCTFAKVVENTSASAGCPVEIRDFGVARPLGGTSDALGHVWEGNFSVHFKNSSERQILGIKFGVDVMDGVGDFRPALFDVSYSGGRVGPGKKGDDRWRVPEWNDGEPAGSRLWVKKVAFTDGTTWVDDGTKSCRMTFDYR